MDSTSLHVPLFNVYQFSFLAALAAVGAVLQGAVERLAGARGAQEGRVRVLAECLRLVHLVVGLWPVLELEDYQYDEHNRYQRGRYNADYQRGVLGRLGRYPLVVVVLGRSGHRRVQRRRSWRRRLRHLRGGARDRHSGRSVRHDAAAKRNDRLDSILFLASCFARARVKRADNSPAMTCVASFARPGSFARLSDLYK